MATLLGGISVDPREGPVAGSMTQSFSEPPPQLIRELRASDGDGGIGTEWTGSLLTHANQEQGEKWWGEPVLLSQRSQVLPDVLSLFCVDRLRVLTAHQNLGLASRESLFSVQTDKATRS